MTNSKLLEQRARLVKQIEEIKAAGPAGRSEAAARFWQEDMLELAKKIHAIDVKTGRTKP